MQSKFTAIVLAMLLAVSAFAVEDTGNAPAQSKGWDDTFTKFSMGVMLGIGPSYLKGAEEYYDAEKTTGLSIMFEMAFPITDNMALRAELGFDGMFGIGLSISMSIVKSKTRCRHLVLKSRFSGICFCQKTSL